VSGPSDDKRRLAVTRLGWDSGYAGIFTDDEINLAFRDPTQIVASWTEGTLAVGFVAEADGEMVGVADLMTLLDGDALVEPMHVVPDFQGIGVGTTLWDLCVDAARSLGVKVVWVWVLERNRGAVRFYEGRGAQRTDMAGSLRIGAHVEPAIRYRFNLSIPRSDSAV
jgi:GNAT superfamily N-acetyltransferase